MAGGYMTQNVCRTDAKTCKRCGKEKLLSEFYARLDKEARCKICVKELRRKYYRENKSLVIGRVRSYSKANPEKIRDTKLRQSYGVDVDYYNAKLKEQGGVCGSCRKYRPNTWCGQKVHMSLDHDHVTGKPRGVLCMRCNRALGLLWDDLEVIIGLAKYKKKYQK